MLAMTIILILFIVAASAATLYVLVRGVIGMAQGNTALNFERSQKWMRQRVFFQAAALFGAVLVMMLGRSA